MAISRSVWDQLKSQTASDLIRVLQRDGWIEEDRRGAGARRGFVKDTQNGTEHHRIVIHYHPKKTYGPRLLKDLIESTGWTEADLLRLGLVKAKRTKPPPP